MEKTLASVRAVLRPQELRMSVVEKYLQALQDKIGSQAIVAAGGSYAKGTFIKGSHDIDVFIRFPLGTSDTAMSAAIKHAVPKAKVLHGSRDYFQVQHKGYTFELVPVLHIENWQQAQNVMDMSPLHVGYVAKHLSEKQKDDARLAKQFTKAAGIYGAESFIRGFSGYVLELLLSIYGSFEKLLRAGKEWKEGVVLDPQQHYRTPQEAVRRLNEAKTLSPLIIIDPVQPDRNAAAALSLEAFNTFKAKADAFLAKPSKEFFEIEVKRSRIQKEWKGKKIIFVAAQTPKGKRDIVGCKVRARHDKSTQLFTDNDFPLLHADWRFDEKKSLCWYVLETTTLPKTREQRGPPSHMAESVAQFRKKHKKAHERGGRWYATVPRKYTQARQVISTAWKGMRISVT